MPYDEQKLTDVFRTIFNMPDLVLRDDLTAREVPGWDSFNHVNLVIAIETEFGVRFATDEVAALQNVGDLKRLLEQKL
jgi:acyl carrier protein